MVKLTIKLVIVGLIANALFQVVPPYYTNWQFTDALKELATFRNGGLFVPLAVGQQTVIFPGFDGGPF